MQSYKRKITYFYQYHNGNVGSTAGFLKLEIRGDKVKIMINIQEMPGLPYSGASLYFYHEAGDHLAALKVDKVESINGILTYQNRTDWQQLFDTGRDLYTFDGVAVVYSDSHYYIGDFQDKNRKDYALVLKEKKSETVKTPRTEKQYPDTESVDKKEPASIKKETIKTQEPEKQEKNAVSEGHEQSEKRVDFPKTKEPEKTIRPAEATKNSGSIEAANSDTPVKKEETEPQKKAEASGEAQNGKGIVENLSKKEGTVQKENSTCTKSGKDVYEKCGNCPYYKRRMEQQEQEDAFEKMLAEYPKLPVYGATELFNCVRIHPKDIGKLDMRNWKLGVNSFLTHGFYTYQYLLLGKMRFDNGSEHPIIGVPGVYSNREKYLANMFGFEQFIPVKKTGVKTGEFGYWIVEISPYL